MWNLMIFWWNQIRFEEVEIKFDSYHMVISTKKICLIPREIIISSSFEPKCEPNPASYSITFLFHFALVYNFFHLILYLISFFFVT